MLVFEDLHWADAVLLDFIDLLVDRTRDAPLLVVCTARPELLEQRPFLGGGKTNALTLLLQPLADDEVGTLIDHLIDPTLVAPDAREQLLERTAGNALFAQEYVRALVEAGLTGAAALPDTIQGIIAARLDALSREEKSLLQDAAVIGEPSWDGALQVLGARDVAATDALIERLDRKQLLRRQRRSTIAGENQLRFAHSLIREVAYAQLTRPERARRHQAAADWIVSRAERGDTAELIAHHLTTALEIDRQLERPDPDLVGRARDALLAATRQAAARHDHAAAIQHAGAALDLEPSADARAELLAARATAGYHRGERSVETLDEARVACIGAGRLDIAVRISVLIYLLLVRSSGATPELERRVDESIELAAALPPCLDAADAIAARAFVFDISGRTDAAMAVLAGPIADARAARHEEAEAILQGARGTVRAGAGDLEGITDLREAYEVLDRYANPRASTRAHNIGLALLSIGLPEEAVEMLAEALAWARRVGSVLDETGTGAVMAEAAWVLGDTAEAERLAGVTAASSVDPIDGLEARCVVGFLVVDRDPAAALAVAEAGLVQMEGSDWPEVAIVVHTLRACAFDRLDDPRVHAALDGLVDVWHRAPATLSTIFLAQAADVFARRGREHDLAAAAATLPVTSVRAAIELLVARRYAEAADVFAAIPMVPMRDAARRLATSAASLADRG